MATISTPTPDPLLDTQMFWMRHKATILGGLVAVVLAVGAYGSYRLYAIRRDHAAAVMLSQAKGAADYEKVISEYPAAAAAPSAYLLLAAAQRKEQKLAEANATLKAFIDKNSRHDLVTTAKMATAANLEAMGKPDEALEIYRRLAANHPRSFNAPLAMLEEVPLLKAKGDIEGARRVCETVLTQYRDTYAAAEATRSLRMLKWPSAAAGTTSGVLAPEVDDAAAAASPVASTSPMP